MQFILSISQGFARNFRIHANAEVQGVPYDFDSLMQYRATAFAKPGKRTIVPIDPKINPASLGQRSHLSTFDMLQVNIRYCPG